MHKRVVFYIFIFTIALFSFSSLVFAGTVLSSYKYAWSNNVGYINFENVTVENDTLSGYAWSKTYGWIKFNPVQSGVLNDAGDLSGSAWGEQLGWINFDNVSIDPATGKFSGVATGNLVGTINFDCPTYCDVRTDWRPTCPTVANASIYNAFPTCGPATCVSGYTVSGGACVASGGGGGGGGSFILPSQPTHVETLNENLTIDPDQSGRYIKDTDNGQIIVYLPSGSISKKITIYITEDLLSGENEYLVFSELELINSTFYDVTVKDQDGNFVNSFIQPITITLPAPINLQSARNLGVYWLNETNNQWVLIPEAVFADNKAVFEVDHLTKLAIFGDIDEETISGGNDKTPDDKKPEPSLLISDDNLSGITEDNYGDPSGNQSESKDEPRLDKVIKKTDNTDNKTASSTINKLGSPLNLIGWFLWIILLLLLIWLVYRGRKRK